MLATALLLGLTGLAGAFVLYLTARRFHVEEDPRIDNIESLLPGANCGACGCRGCRDLQPHAYNAILLKTSTARAHAKAR